jgi:dihydroorotate dehydrogenase electron transfer subunit
MRDGRPTPVNGLWQTAANRALCREHYCLTLSGSVFPPARPGQFVTLAPPRTVDREDLAAPFYLRRAFSIAALRRPAGHVEIDVIYRVVGAATTWMAALRAGDTVSVVGPLGNILPTPDGIDRAWLVAGGVGLPPVLWMAETLKERAVPTTAFFGARTADLIPLTIDRGGAVPSDAGVARPCVAEFARLDVPTVLCTDDGSLGVCGRVVNAVDAHWRSNPPGDEKLVIYACGPERMLQALAEWSTSHAIDCYVCMERAMACGVGTCQSCVVPVRAEGDSEWSYHLCCTDGPVFDARLVLWSEPDGAAST